MPRKQKTYHIIYKTTCSLTNRYYYGMHSTNNLNDGYVGSGMQLWRSINKHGIENHTCECLEFLDSREKLKEREIELVNPDLLKDPLCMNLTVGGGNGWYILNCNSEIQKVKSKKANERKEWLRKNDPEWVKRSNKNLSLSILNTYKSGRIPNPPDWNGRTHKEETKLKMQARAKQRLPSQNSQFGTRWITNGTEVKKIHKDESIPENWKLGRK